MPKNLWGRLCREIIASICQMAESANSRLAALFAESGARLLLSTATCVVVRVTVPSELHRPRAVELVGIIGDGALLWSAESSGVPRDHDIDNGWKALCDTGEARLVEALTHGSGWTWRS